MRTTLIAIGQAVSGRRGSRLGWLWPRLAALVLAAGLTPAAAQAQEVIEYYHHDALGSVRAVTNAAGQVVRRYDYLPYGELREQPPEPLADRRLFTGQERDQETGLDYFGARYYRPDLARFTTVDPALTAMGHLGDPQRWNRYAYARNNPLSSTRTERCHSASGLGRHSSWLGPAASGKGCGRASVTGGPR